MLMIIGASINCAKIDKSKIVVGKDGALYYNFDIIVNTKEADKYGNHAQITQKQTKEQREAKEKKEYFGNGKIVWQSESKIQESQPQSNSNNKSLPM